MTAQERNGERERDDPWHSFWERGKSGKRYSLMHLDQSKKKRTSREGEKIVLKTKQKEIRQKLSQMFLKFSRNLLESISSLKMDVKAIPKVAII